MWCNIMRTNDDKVLTLLRVALGIVRFPASRLAYRSPAHARSV